MKNLCELLLLVFVFCMIAFRCDVNSDAWFLLNHGRYVVTYGFPHVEPFTIHEGFHFVMQQWLFALGLWRLYENFGVHGLIAFSWVAGAVLLFAYYRLQLVVSRENRQLSALLTCTFGIFACVLFTTQRPQVVSGLLFLLEIYLLEWQRERMARWLPIVFFLLSSLLVNFHAAMWPMMLVFLLPYAAEILLGGRWHFCERTFAWRLRDIILIVAAVLLGGFMGPYGIEAMLYGIHGYGYAEVSGYVTEMQPLAFINAVSGSALLLLFVLTVVYARGRLPLHYLLLAAGTGLMSLSALRSLFLFLLFGTLPLGILFRNFQIKQRACAWRVSCGRIILIAVPVLAILGWLLWLAGTMDKGRQLLLYGAIFVLVILALFAARAFYRQRHDGVRLAAAERQMFLSLLALALIPFSLYTFKAPPPVPTALVHAADVLCASTSREDVRLCSEYQDGNYFEFLGIPCYIDARAEVFLPELNHQKNIMKEFVNLREGHVHYREIQQAYQLTHFEVRKGSALYTYLAADPDYVVLYDSAEDDAIPEEEQAGDHIRLYAYHPREVHR